MLIAVNTRFLLPGYKEGFGHYIHEVFLRITRKNPDHHFVFIYDRPQVFETGWPSNVEHIVLGPPARHTLLWKWWYDYRVPSLLNKIKADVFFSPDGFCSLRTKVPQCLVIHDLAYLNYPQGIKPSHLQFYKKYTPKFIRQSQQLITVSNFSKKELTSNFNEANNKTVTIYNGVREIFHPATAVSARETKTSHTGGKEFFLYAGSIHPRKNLVNLLKAFSLFKKRQQSSMKLVLAGRLAWKNEKFLEDLKSYKYRDDVVLTGYLPDKELVPLMGAAYAFIYPSLYEGFGLPVVEAMRSGVPVITSAGSAMQEVCREAALYCDPLQPSSIAEKMMLLYKDEKLRKELIEKGNRVQSHYSWDEAAEKIWEVILAVPKPANRTFAAQ